MRDPTATRPGAVTTSGQPPAAPDRAVVLGCVIDRLDMRQTLARIEALVEERSFAQHVAINAAKIVAMRKDPALREVIERCELISADGQSVVWASRLLGDPLPERVAGIDLMQELLGLAERRGLRVYILGARPEVLARAVERIRERHPDLVLAGARDGYFAPDEDAAVAEEIRTARPDLLFVAISSPRKEFFLGTHGRDIDVPFVMGVGGSIDVIAGLTRRAPRLWQVAGMEWLYRLLQEPGRLWKRYLATNVTFGLLIVRALLGRRTERG